ncbi:DUF3800 domain-containing protein [Nonomuraea africana]|uniref:DUF3800 domain-containing protein n=1 Tax=Nonomuraea africana TaxID=46171 RepID=UPI0033E730B6
MFTQKWRTGGDPFAPLSEVPLFAASDNHAGLQIADLLASTLVFPMAASAYCPPATGGPGAGRPPSRGCGGAGLPHTGEPEPRTREARHGRSPCR